MRNGCTTWLAVGCKGCKKLQSCEVVKLATLIAGIRK